MKIKRNCYTDFFRSMRAGDIAKIEVDEPRDLLSIVSIAARLNTTELKSRNLRLACVRDYSACVVEVSMLPIGVKSIVR